MRPGAASRSALILTLVSCSALAAQQSDLATSAAPAPISRPPEKPPISAPVADGAVPARRPLPGGEAPVPRPAPAAATGQPSAGQADAMGGADDPSAAKPDPARGPEPAPVSSAPAETGEAPSGSRPPAARPDAANISATAAADDNAADDTGDSDSDSDSDGPQPDAENAGGTAADDGSAADRGDPGPGEDMPSDAGADPQAVSATDDGPQPADDARAASAHAAADAAAGPPAWQLLAEDDFTYQSCLLGLFMLGVEYQELPAIADEEDRDCGIARPLNITAVQPGLSIAGGAVMRCDTARRLARWARDFALPAAAQLSGAPRITALIPGSTYQCRARVGTGQARLSEHALGNAFDLSALQLSDGREIAIAPRDGTGTLDEALQKTLHHAGCLYFTTVLGPGSNAAHDDHLHFDIMTRKNDWRLCE